MQIIKLQTILILNYKNNIIRELFYNFHFESDKLKA